MSTRGSEPGWIFHRHVLEMPFPSPAPFTLMRHLTPKLVCGPLDVTSLEGAWAVFNPVSAAWLGAALGSCPSFHSEGGWGHPSRLTHPHQQISAIQKISVQLDSPPLQPLSPLCYHLPHSPSPPQPGDILPRTCNGQVPATGETRTPASHRVVPMNPNASVSHWEQLRCMPCPN